MEDNYVCKIANIEEMNIKWDYEIDRHKEDKINWIIWKEKNIDSYLNGYIIAYYGILNGEIICEATAMIKADIVQNSDGLVDADTVYLSAFRTNSEYQGRGYFSKLFKYMLNDLKGRGIVKVTLGVEPEEIQNKEIYKHYGFEELIKVDYEKYPDGTSTLVEYYGKRL